VRKWLGEAHPLLIQLYRILAEYYSENQFYYSKALQFASESLKMHRILFEGDSEPIWRDYYLVGKVHYINNRLEEALNHLSKAKALVKAEKLTEFESYGELCLILAKGYFGAKYYKESYSIVRELYKNIKDERDERSLINIV
jgi:tetratricopeptide (TPR) repeat protein